LGAAAFDVDLVTGAAFTGSFAGFFFWSVDVAAFAAAVFVFTGSLLALRAAVFVDAAGAFVVAADVVRDAIRTPFRGSVGVSGAVLPISGQY
jgi:hypothetical protein